MGRKVIKCCHCGNVITDDKGKTTASAISHGDTRKVLCRSCVVIGFATLVSGLSDEIIMLKKRVNILEDK